MSEQGFDFSFYNDQMPPGVLRKNLILAAFNDPEVVDLAERMLNTPGCSLPEDVELVAEIVARKYLMDTSDVKSAIHSRVDTRINEIQIERIQRRDQT